MLLKNANGANQEVARTDPAGVFHFQSVPAGKYDIEVSAPGFATLRKSAFPLDSDSRADFSLEIGHITETVDVVGPARASLPQSSAGSSGPIRVGGRVQATRLIQMVQPIYPLSAQAAGVEGSVLLQAIISKEGVPTEVSPISDSTDIGLVRAATDAVRQWRYQPTLLNNFPVAVLTTITVNFHLQH